MASNYPDSHTSASHSVLIDVLTVLGKYLDATVIVGGWVPELIYPNRGHVGSLDVDIALDGRKIKPMAYNTIKDRLLQAGYRLQSPDTTSVFLRDVQGTGQTIVVKLDLVTGEQTLPANDRQYEHIHGMNLTKLRGMDLALDHAMDITISGQLPDGGHNQIKARIATVAAFVCIKCITMTERKRAKDAYDIYFCLRENQGGPLALASTFKPLRGVLQVEEALNILAAKFKDQDQIGPVWAAQVAANHGEDEHFVRRDACERALAMLRALGVTD